MKYIHLKLTTIICLHVGMQFCSESSSARTSQESVVSSTHNQSRSRSGSIVSKLRQATKEVLLMSQVAEQAAAIAQEKNKEQLRLKKLQDRKKRHSFMESSLK